MPTLKPTFTLTVGGLTSTSANAVAGPGRIVIERDMDVPADAAQITLMQRGGVNLGDPVEIKLGHDGDEETAFMGTVVALQPGLSGVVIRALGKMQTLLDLRTAGTFENQSVGSIVQDLIGRSGMDTGTIDDGPQLPRFAVDRRLSGYAHVKDLADRLGFELYADRTGKAMFRGLGPAASLDAGGGLLGAAAAALGLGGGGEGYAFGKNLLAAIGVRRPAAWSAIKIGGESPMSQQGDETAHWLTTSDSDFDGAAGDGDPQLLQLDAVARTKDLADRFAAGRLAVATRRAGQATITTLGRPQVDLGDDLSINGVADNLVNASGYVRAIRHCFGDAIGFVTDFRIFVDTNR